MNQFNEDYRDKINFALPKGMSQVTWLESILAAELHRVNKCTKRLEGGDTNRSLTDKAMFHAVLYNAITIVEKVRGYEIPKLNNAKDISKIDHAVVTLKTSITRFAQLLGVDITGEV